MDKSKTQAIDLGQAQKFTQQVAQRSGQPLLSCYQCKRCAAGCPVADDSADFTPDKLIRTIIFGDLTSSLDNQLIWRCVSCYTCGARCPNGIQTGRITEILKQMSHEQAVRPLQVKVDIFHHSFLNSAIRFGRVNELEFMLHYETQYLLKLIKNKNFSKVLQELATQTKLGRTMYQLKRLHLTFTASKGRKVFKRIAKEKGHP